MRRKQQAATEQTTSKTTSTATGDANKDKKRIRGMGGMSQKVDNEEQGMRAGCHSAEGTYGRVTQMNWAVPLAAGQNFYPNRVRLNTRHSNLFGLNQTEPHLLKFVGGSLILRQGVRFHYGVRITKYAACTSSRPASHKVNKPEQDVGGAR